MTIWDVLKINRTDNIRAIRMAYVKGLCEINPEEFSIPDFLAAHEAYQRALLYARSGTDPDYEIPEDRNSLRITRGVIAYMEPIVRLRELALPDTAKTGTPPDVIKHLSDIVFFYTMMMALQDDFYSRIEVENWKELLQSDILESADPSVFAAPTARFGRGRAAIAPECLVVFGRGISMEQLNMAPKDYWRKCGYRRQKRIPDGLEFFPVSVDQETAGTPEGERTGSPPDQMEYGKANARRLSIRTSRCMPHTGDFARRDY